MHRRDNPNYVRRTGDTNNVYVIDPNRITQNEMDGMKFNAVHEDIETAAADRLSRRRIVDVQRVMPYIRRCREMKRAPRRVPADVLKTIEQLKLV